MAEATRVFSSMDEYLSWKAERQKKKRAEKQKKQKLKEKHSCRVCNKKVSSKASLNRHLKTIHKVDVGLASVTSFVCVNCEDKTFANIDDLQKHLESEHEFIMDKEALINYVSSNDKIQCSICPKRLSNNFGLARHMKNVHKLTPPIMTNVVCMDCQDNKKFFSIRTLRNHLQKEHGYVMDTEALTFPTMDDFFSWKSDIEKRTNSSYSKLSGTKRASHSSNKIHRFKCHRSGVFHSRGTGQRNLKAQGSCKMGYTCTSCITAIETGNGIEVEFIKTHYMHANEDVHQFTLSDEEKGALLSKFQVQIQFQSILDDIHVLGDVSPISDVENINRWAYARAEHGKNPILCFKQPGEADESGIFGEQDIFLVLMTTVQKELLVKFGSFGIWIDSSRGINTSNLQLTTILIIDECTACVPVAFCISDRVDMSTLEMFFSLVAKAAGMVSTKAFMTGAPGYYTAWKNVMGQAEKHLICTWYMDQEWRDQLLKVEAGDDEKVLVYKTLQDLMHHERSETFREALKNFKKLVFNSKAMKKFGEDFFSQYGTKGKMWAICYRSDLDITANSHIENMHYALKYVYMECLQNKRIDKLIEVLLKLLRDKLYGRLVKFKRGRTCKKIKQIHQRHNEGLKIPYHKITQLLNNTWLVESDETFEVFQYDQTCSCNTKCTYCSVCVHIYGCKCDDHMLHGNMCKHIHAVIVYAKKLQYNEEISSHIMNSNPSIECADSNDENNISENENIYWSSDISENENPDNASNSIDQNADWSNENSGYEIPDTSNGNSKNWSNQDVDNSDLSNVDVRVEHANSAISNKSNNQKLNWLNDENPDWINENDSNDPPSNMDVFINKIQVVLAIANQNKDDYDEALSKEMIKKADELIQICDLKKQPVVTETDVESVRKKLRKR